MFLVQVHPLENVLPAHIRLLYSGLQFGQVSVPLLDDNFHPVTPTDPSVLIVIQDPEQLRTLLHRYHQVQLLQSKLQLIVRNRFALSLA
jgi:hypothetical protein